MVKGRIEREERGRRSVIQNGNINMKKYKAKQLL
jgi:hypothetical protein